MPYKNTHTNPNTTFIYVLQSGDEIRYIGKSDHPRKRLSEHKATSGFKNPHLHRWMKKAGDVSLEVIDEVLKDEWKFWEMWYIDLFRAWGFRLVNLTIGGDGAEGYKHTEETKLRMRQNHADYKGKNHPQYGMGGMMKGKKHSETTKIKMSIRQRGENNHRYGKKCVHSKETVLKCSEAKKEAWKNGVYGSEEYKQKMRDCRLGKPLLKVRKPIKCNESGVVYESIRDASMKIVGSLNGTGNITSQLKGKLKTAYKHTFSYLGNQSN